jgi:hypothetical protein
MAAGIQTAGTSPMSTPRKAAAATPMTVIGKPLSRTLRPTTSGAPPSAVHRRRVAAEHAVEEPLLLHEVAADGVRHEVAASPAFGEGVALPVDEDEALRLPHRQEAEEDLVHEREDRRAGADADGQRQKGGGREARVAQEGARGVAHVSKGVVEPAPDPRFAHVLLDLVVAPELDGRPPSGFVFAEAGGD